jgi:hypothetical protein
VGAFPVITRIAGGSTIRRIARLILLLPVDLRNLAGLSRPVAVSSADLTELLQACYKVRLEALY